MAGTHGNGHFYTGFPFIFFGLLLLAGILAIVLHKRWKGLPKIGERFYDPIVLFQDYGVLQVIDDVLILLGMLMIHSSHHGMQFGIPVLLPMEPTFSMQFYQKVAFSNSFKNHFVH